MSIEEIVLLLGVVFGGVGTVGGIYGYKVTRKLGLSTNEITAKRDLNGTMDSIIENLQARITTSETDFRQQLTILFAEIKTLKEGQAVLEDRLGQKERLLLAAIGHINKLEALVPPKPIPVRPAGLE